MYNILVLEDEKFVREGIVGILKDEKEFNVLSADNGAKALEIIESMNISGMLLDIQVPKINGLELLEILKNRGINNIITFVISGFDKFEYAQQAIQFGVTEYLLKPLIPENVEEISLKLKKHLKFQEQEEERITELKNKVDFFSSATKEKMLWDILEGKISSEVMKQKLDNTGFYIDSDELALALIHISGKQQGNNGNSIIKQQILDSIEEYISEKIKDNTYCVFRLDSQLFALLHSRATENPISHEELSSNISALKTNIIRKYNVAVNFGVGNYCFGIEDLSNSYYEAINSIMYKSLESSYSTYPINNIDGNLQVDPEEISTLLLNLDSDTLQKKISSIFRKMHSLNEKNSYYVIYLTCLNLICTFLSVVERVSGRLDLFFNGKNNPFRRLSTLNTIDDMENLILEIIIKTEEEVKKNVNEKSSFLVLRIQRFIRENYMNTIDSRVLAELHSYSSAYTGKVFKKYTGYSIKEYTNRIRLEQAKILLQSTDCLVSDIAFKTGFNGEQYFSSLFKKYTGKSPQQYREIQS